MFPGSTDVDPRALNVILPPPTVIVGLVANAPPSKRPNVEYVIKAAYEVVGMASKGSSTATSLISFIVVGMAPPRVCDTSKRLTLSDGRVDVYRLRQRGVFPIRCALILWKRVVDADT